jgi:hypothetical protein
MTIVDRLRVLKVRLKDGRGQPDRNTRLRILEEQVAELAEIVEAMATPTEHTVFDDDATNVEYVTWTPRS